MNECQMKKLNTHQNIRSIEFEWLNLNDWIRMIESEWLNLSDATESRDDEKISSLTHLRPVAASRSMLGPLEIKDSQLIREGVNHAAREKNDTQWHSWAKTTCL